MSSNQRLFYLTAKVQGAIQVAATSSAVMMNQQHCPFCRTPAVKACAHLAVAVEARDFVRRCVELSQGQAPWQKLSRDRREDFTWLETAFCDEFLRRLRSFGAMDHEWRSGPKAEQGGFWVLLWSKNPRQLWWELREELERKTLERPGSESSPVSRVWLTPR